MSAVHRPVAIAAVTWSFLTLLFVCSVGIAGGSASDASGITAVFFTTSSKLNYCYFALELVCLSLFVRILVVATLSKYDDGSVLDVSTGGVRRR